MKAHRSLSFALGVLTLLGACESQVMRTRLVREWPAEQISEVRLHGLNGRVDVQSDAGGKVRLIAEIHAAGRPAREALERGLVSTELNGERLEIREKTFSKKLIEVIPVFNTGQVRINYLLTVPESTDVTVRTRSGRIESKGISGSLNLETINGRIRVETPRAQLWAKTVNGSIGAVFTDEFRGAQLHTVNGSIRLSVPPGSSIDAQVDQVNGAFRTNIPVRVNTSPGQREVTGSIAGGEFPLEISTINGSVTLESRVPGVPAVPPVPGGLPVPPVPGTPATPTVPAPAPTR